VLLLTCCRDEWPFRKVDFSVIKIFPSIKIKLSEVACLSACCVLQIQKGTEYPEVAFDASEDCSYGT